MCKTDTALGLCGRVFQAIPLVTLYTVQNIYLEYIYLFILHSMYYIPNPTSATKKSAYFKEQQEPPKKQSMPHIPITGNLLDVVIIGLRSMSYIFFVSM
jgi:hypothetical protein